MHDPFGEKVPKKVKFATLGCRLNQYETQAIREQFVNAGFEETESDEEAHLFVLNTCTVTSESDRQSRYLIRKFHRKNPAAEIVVTGCYVERNENEIKKVPGVSLTVLNRQKSEIVNLLERRGGSRTAPTCLIEPALPSKRIFTPLSISQFQGRRRAYIKVQDGCNHACSFCKVVLVRGPARSRMIQEIVDEAKRLVDQGFKEVVLTGIQLGAYGLDLGKRQMLVDLFEVLSKIDELKRIRLSSIEPTDVTDELINAMAFGEKICHHLHIPLQSGDDLVLEKMNRRYRSDFFLDLIAKVRAKIKDFVLTTDVMVGFPGETEFQFNQTIEVLLKTEPYKLHIFPYSAREGTRASRFPDDVPDLEKQRRRNVLLLLEEKMKCRVQEKFLNETLEILLEEGEEEAGWLYGRAANYLKVRFPFNSKESDLHQVQIKRIEKSNLIGRKVA